MRTKKPKAVSKRLPKVSASAKRSMSESRSMSREMPRGLAGLGALRPAGLPLRRRGRRKIDV